jgi:hypothetical protein
MRVSPLVIVHANVSSCELVKVIFGDSLQDNEVGTTSDRGEKSIVNGAATRQQLTYLLLQKRCGLSN